MPGRPKTKRGQKVHTAFKIYPDDKERAQVIANKLDISLSAYINKAVLEKVERDEKSEAQTEANQRTRTTCMVVQ